MPNEASVQLSAVDRTLLLGLKRLVAVTVEKPDAETYLSPLMDMIYELVEDIAENATKQDLDQGGAALDCKMGCAHCCNVYDVDTTAFELFRIIDFVSENFTPERIEELNAEIAEQNIFKQRAGEKTGFPL